MWKFLCRRELIGLTRAFRPATQVVRYLLSLGVFLPLLAGLLPWVSPGFLSESFQILVLCSGSAYLAVWVHESTARDVLNRETLVPSGVSPRRLFAAKAMVGAAGVCFCGVTALICSWFQEPLLRLWIGPALQRVLFLTLGLNLSLSCSLWVASQVRPRSEVMPEILFSLTFVWLGLPLATLLGRELFGFSGRPLMLTPVLMLTGSVAGVSPAEAAMGLAWLAALTTGFFLAAISRLGPVGPESHGGESSSSPRFARSFFVSGKEPCPRCSLDDPRYPRLGARLSDAPRYLESEFWFFCAAAVCYLLHYSNLVWLWIALSALVVAQLHWGSWIWRATIMVVDEDRQIGDVVVVDQLRGLHLALRRWIGHISRMNRWIYFALYAVVTLTAWTADPDFPWMLFALLASSLWVMPSLLSGVILDSGGTTSRAFLQFVGVLVLIACPLCAGAVVSHVAGAKGFLVGTAVGAFIVLLGLALAQLVVRSRLYFMARWELSWCTQHLTGGFRSRP